MSSYWYSSGLRYVTGGSAPGASHYWRAYTSGGPPHVTDAADYVWKSHTWCVSWDGVARELAPAAQDFGACGAFMSAL